MKVIELLKKRIKDFEYQQQKLNIERDNLIEYLENIHAKINEYQNDIEEIQIAIEKLEKMD